MSYRENVPLSGFTTMRVGGPARYFFSVTHIQELKEAVDFAKTEKLPMFILGGGSNILVSDNGFNGVVIKMDFKGITLQRQDNSYVRVSVGAGEVWDAFVENMVAQDLRGLENLSYIPGSVGAAPVQNIGAYGVEAKDRIVSVEIFDPQTNTVRILSKDECQFGYRDSVFKHEGKGWIVTTVQFMLDTVSPFELSYKGVAEALEGVDPTVQDVRNAVIAVRKSKLPDVADIGTAGSFFKNPVVGKEMFDQLAQEYPGLPGIDQGNGRIKLSAAWLLEHVGKWKGYRNGDAGVYDKHALVLVNHGAAQANDMFMLADAMTESVKTKTGITLEREVIVV